MTIFPRPRVIFFIALALAIPTYGVSLAIFYFFFKRPYDSAGLSAIFAAAKRSMESRRAGQVVKIDSGAIERAFAKFSDPAQAIKYGKGRSSVRWGVITHPMLNGGLPFTLRVDDSNGLANVEASPGVAWWLLTDRVWLGRRGTAPGIPQITVINDAEFSDAGNAAISLLIMELAHWNEEVELLSISYGQINDFVYFHKSSTEWYPNHKGMHFYVQLRTQMYRVTAYTIDPEKKSASGILISAEKCKS